MAKPIFQNQSTVVNDNSSTSVTVTAPSGIQDNDCLFASIVIADTITVSSGSGPTGWSSVSGSTGNGATMLTFYKVASSESGNYTFSWTGSARNIGAVYLIRGTDTTTPLGAQSFATGTTDVDPPSVTNSSAEDCLILTNIGALGKSSLDSTTAPSGYTLSPSAGQTAGGGSPSSHIGQKSAYAGFLNTTTTDPGTFGSSSSDHVVSTAFFQSATGPTTNSAFQYYNGTAFANTVLKYWNGSSWITPGSGKIKYYNGTQWIELN